MTLQHTHVPNLAASVPALIAPGFATATTLGHSTSRLLYKERYVKRDTASIHSILLSSRSYSSCTAASQIGDVLACLCLAGKKCPCRLGDNTVGHPAEICTKWLHNAKVAVACNWVVPHDAGGTSVEDGHLVTVVKQKQLHASLQYGQTEQLSSTAVRSFQWIATFGNCFLMGALGMSYQSISR
jgi:hypothetical protein